MELVENRQGKKTFNDLTYKVVQSGQYLNRRDEEAWVSRRLDFFQNVNGKEVLVGYITFRKYVNGPFDLYYISSFTVLPEFRHRKQKDLKGGIYDVGLRMLENAKKFIELQNKILRRQKRFAIVTLNDGTKKDDNPRGVWNFYRRYDFVQLPNGSSHELFFPERKFTREEYSFLKKVLYLP